MLYILSKCAFLNLFKHPRNITLLKDTLVSCGLGLSSRHLNICTKRSKFADIGLSIVLLRFRRIYVASSLANNWKFMWQVSWGGLSPWLHSPTWLFGCSDSTLNKPSATLIKPHKKCARESNYFWFILCTVWEIFFTFLRAIRLGVTILPILMLYPIALISDSLKNIWYHLLLFALEISGPIFIKLGQWASTRRDLFSIELCSRLEKLQRKNSRHSWYYTSKSFERVFGPNWQDFLWLDNGGQPVGSGCCAQVYKGWVDFDIVKDQEEAARLAGTSHCTTDYEEDNENSFCVEALEMFWIGSLLSSFQTLNLLEEEDEKRRLVPVAIKVLHPGMITTLRRDLYIMKTAANLFTWLVPSLKWISLPECVDDFTALMKAQVDFCIEASNLEVFAENFADVKAVRFPRPFWSLTKSFVMVETFEEGRPMEYYIKNDNTKETNLKIAHIGVNALLKMVFDDNFAHGDLHPGNMLVQEQELKCNTFSSWWKFRKNKETEPELCVVILDCGIVVSLDERGKRLLRQVFRAVARGEGRLVAELFLENSTHQCPDPEKFKEAMHVLVITALGKLTGQEVSSLIAQLFATMIEHRVKMDGCFSSVILAMMVVEGMGHSLDSSINLVDTAKPFLFKPVLGLD